MALIAATVVSLVVLVPLCAVAMQEGAASAITVARAGSQASRSGPAEWFTGSVRIDPLFQAEEPSRVSGALVTIEPGARTAWHKHPLGQTLVVTAGEGQRRAIPRRIERRMTV